jgi:hypothetical protein
MASVRGIAVPFLAAVLAVVMRWLPARPAGDNAKGWTQPAALPAPDNPDHETDPDNRIPARSQARRLP